MSPVIVIHRLIPVGSQVVLFFHFTVGFTFTFTFIALTKLHAVRSVIFCVCFKLLFCLFILALSLRADLKALQDLFLWLIPCKSCFSPFHVFPKYCFCLQSRQIGLFYWSFQAVLVSFTFDQKKGEQKRKRNLANLWKLGKPRTKCSDTKLENWV